VFFVVVFVVVVVVVVVYQQTGSGDAGIAQWLFRAPDS